MASSKITEEELVARISEFMSQRHSVSGKDPTWTKDLEYRNYGII